MRSVEFEKQGLTGSQRLEAGLTARVPEVDLVDSWRA
jgi:hypothetical protein